MENLDRVMKETENGSKSVYERISPKFNEATSDIREIAKQCNDPFFISLLLFKLAEEREKTNKILSELNEKFDRVFRESNKTTQESTDSKSRIEILPEKDQRILDFVEQHGMAEAKQIMKMLDYNGKNAASQRLNKLYREGHLRKVRSGRKVFYLKRT